MRDNVQKGSASFLKGHPDLMGVASGNDTDRCFFGSRGDLAFAVFVADADGGDRAVKMTDLLMREWPSRRRSDAAAGEQNCLAYGGE